MSTESEAQKLSQAAAAASDHVFRGGPPPGGGGAQIVVPGRGGDWVCPGCNDLQFGKNEKCRRCGTPNPKPPAAGKGSGMRVGDWICPTCSDFQYARNAQCRRCGTPNPHRDAGAPSRQMRPGDWQCPTCHDVVFARNAVCRRCQTPNPNASAGVNPNRFNGDLADLPAGQCRYFATGFCKEGAQCRYQHGDGSQGGGVGGPPPAGRRQCRFFAEGSCKQGDQCPYTHGDRAGGSQQHKNDVQEEPWRCPNCGQFVFPHFSNCLSCKTPRPVNPERMTPVNVAPLGLEGQPLDGMMMQGDPGQGQDSALMAAAAMAERQLFAMGGGPCGGRSRSPRRRWPAEEMGPTCGN